MASNARPRTRITQTYGPIGTIADRRALSPVLIAPRYAVHGVGDGYADGSLGTYDVTNNELKNIPWPASAGNSLIDVDSATLYVSNALLKVNETPLTASSTEDAPNKLVFDQAVQTENGVTRAPELGGYDVREGDTLYIAKTGSETVTATVVDVQAQQTAANVSAAVYGSDNTGTGTAPATTGSVFTGSNDITYLLEIVSVNGGTGSSGSGSADGTLSARVIALAGATYQATIAFTAGEATAIDAYGVKLTFASITSTAYKVNDRFQISCTAAKDGAVNIVMINTELPSTHLDEELEVSVCSRNVAVGDVAVGESMWHATTSNITIEDSIYVAVGESRYMLMEGDMYVAYREQLLDESLEVIDARSEYAAEFAGLAVPENPMGMWYRLALTAGGTAFYMMSVAEDTDAGYERAVALAGKYEELYAIVCFRQTAAVQAAVSAVIDKYAAPEIAQFKRGWFTPLTTQVSTYYEKNDDGSIILGTIHDSELTLEAPGNAVSGGVRAGDTVTVVNSFNAVTDSYETKSYTVARVVDSSTVALTNAADVDMMSQVVFSRQMTNAQYANAMAAEARSWNNYRINLVWASSINALGYTDIDLAYLPGILAALRAASAPHAPLSDVTVPGITVTDVEKFTDSEYEAMNDGGVWIVANDSFGNAITYHQITTRTDGTIAEEDSVVSNADSIVREFRFGLHEFRGNANVTDALLAQMRANIYAIADQIMGRTYAAQYGPQMTAFEIVSLEEDPANNTGIIGTFRPTLPKPFLNGDFTFNLV
nr:MAG TPA: hypothetical protein [Herelleviridae sp.]